MMKIKSNMGDGSVIALLMKFWPTDQPSNQLTDMGDQKEATSLQQ